MGDMNRRSFIGGVAGVAGVAGAAAVTLSQPRRVLGANERVNLALIGCGGRGPYVTYLFAQRDDTRITWLCDLDEGRLKAHTNRMASAQGGRQPKTTRHMKQVFDAKDVDAVVIATPDHWHAKATILACQAGKDVYVEKPPSHNMYEGRKMIEAARKYSRIVQVGTQNRSAPYNLAARQYVQSGGLGDIHLVKVYNLKSGGPFKLRPDSDAPAGFDWNAWLGPAPPRPYNASIFGGGWHKFWAYSNGDMADDGIHQTDLAMMLMGDPPLPTAASTSGGRLHFRGDDAQVPDCTVCTLDFDGFIMVQELTNYPPYMRKIDQAIRSGDSFPYWPHCATRVELYGSKDQMVIGRHGGGWQVFGDGGKVVAQGFGRPGEPPHQQNFIDCIRSRNRPTADVEIAHRSMTLVHLHNIAHRVGNRKLEFDPKAERFTGEHAGAANALLKRQNATPYSVGDIV